MTNMHDPMEESYSFVLFFKATLAKVRFLWHKLSISGFQRRERNLRPWFSTDNLVYMGLECGVKETRIRLGREEGNISGGRLDRDKGIGVCVCVCGT